MTVKGKKFNLLLILLACPFAITQGRVVFYTGLAEVGFTTALASWIAQYIKILFFPLFSKASKGSATSWSMSIIPFLLFFFFILNLNAQKLKSKTFQPTDEMLKIIKNDLKTIKNGWLNHDFSITIKEDLMHPKIIDLAGGKEALIENTQLEMQAMGNFTIDNVIIEEPKDFTIYNNIIYGIVPFKLTMNFDGTSVSSSAYLLVLSENQGKKFYYLDSNGLKNPLIEDLFPDIKIAAKLPQ